MTFATFRLQPALIALAVAAAGAVLGAAWVRSQHRQAEARGGPDGEVRAAVERILAERAQALIRFDDGSLAEHYDLASTYGKWSLEHEKRRLRYLRAWSQKRGVRLVSAGVNFRIPTIRVSRDEAWVSLIQSARLGYVYEDDPTLEKHLFGIGTRHTMQLVKVGSGWVLRRDWYTDPLDEDALIPEVRPADVSASGGLLSGLARMQQEGVGRCEPPGVEQLVAPDGPGTGRLQGAWWQGLLDGLRVGQGAPGASGKGSPGGGRGRYNRQAAVAYAREFCGAAWGCGNGGAYNPRYRDYTDIGGDCTNFTSQVLHAGGLPMDSVWYYRSGSGGSRAWVQTSSLLNHLLATGRARLLVRGTFAEVMKPRQGLPGGAVAALELGDIVGYQEEGRIVHLATVTGRDFRGYVLVNSHTADRNLVPWDVGWDQGTVFWLIKMRD